MNNEDKLKEISDEIKKCRQCRLWKNRLKAVPGEGSFTSDLIFIGEAPGKKEDQTGRPFVGRAGSLFNELLDYSDIKRKNVFLTSVIKCHPPQNRIPKSYELRTCINRWMDKQINLIDPDYIILLGRVALQAMTGKKKVASNHGKIITQNNNNNYFISYHPAAGLRNPKLKKALFDDFKSLKKILDNY